MRRLPLAMLVFVLLVGSLTGCQGKKPDPGDVAGYDEGEQYLSIWVHSIEDTDEGKCYRESVEAFNEKYNGTYYADIEFIPRNDSGGGYSDKINASVMSGDLPDVLTVDGPNIAAYASNGMIQPLAELTEEEKEVYGSREYVPWKLLRPLAFSLIKGEQTPQLLRIQFVHYMNNGDCGGLRIQYENNELHCISSYTPANFTLDKSSEQMWDDQCSEFFHKNRIVSTRL